MIKKIKCENEMYDTTMILQLRKVRVLYALANFRVPRL